MPRGKKNFAELGKNTRFNGESAAEAARKSVESRRRKKLERDVAQIFAFSVPPIEKIGEYMQRFGLDPTEDRTALEIAFARSVVQPAMGGDREALKMWAEMLGIDGAAVRDKLRYNFEREKLNSMFTSATVPVIIDDVADNAVDGAKNEGGAR